MASKNSIAFYIKLLLAILAAIQELFDDDTPADTKPPTASTKPQ